MISFRSTAIVVVAVFGAAAVFAETLSRANAVDGWAFSVAGEASGIHFDKQVDSYGAFWVFLNEDDLLDLVFMNHGTPPSIYLNQNGKRFIESFRSAGIRSEGWSYPEKQDRHGGSCADFDNDGKVDLFFAHGAKKGETLGTKADELLRNLGSGALTDVTRRAGVLNANGRARLGTWVDYDRDGWLDLYLGNFQSPNVMYRNNGDGTFSERSEALGLSGAGPRAAWVDYDADGDADVLVAWPLRLLRNDGTEFVDVTARSGLSKFSDLAYALAWGDADGDADLDIFIGAYRGTSRLFWNKDRVFNVRDMAVKLGDSEFGAGAVWGDLDNDGDLDLVYATSERLFALENVGSGAFREMPIEGTQGLRFGRGGNPALGDFDGDGNLDLAIDHVGGHMLLRNELANGNKWVEIRLEGSNSNRMAIGARIRVTRFDPQTGSPAAILREYWGAEGTYRSVGCGPLHIGLGKAERVDVEVHWPSGKVSYHHDHEVNRVVRVVEPRSE